MKSSEPTVLHTEMDLSRREPLRGVIFVLRVFAGADLGATLLLDGVNEGRVLLGQSAMCTLRLTDPAVSRRHAALRRDERAWRLEDLDSTNGTRVNGVSIKEAFLVGGELITLGGTSLRLTRAGVASLAESEEGTHFGPFLSASAELRGQFARWTRLAGTLEPIVIEGEPGTGKELLAESIHDASARAAGPFVVLECRTRTDAEVEDALRGARSSGDGASPIFEQARGGTLVIDEPGELSGPLQELLSKQLAASRDAVRVITTTRRDLDHEVQSKRFSESLFDALAGSSIELPPLRRRALDVRLLADHFWRLLGAAGELPEAETAKLANRAWPGNVRELLNVVAEMLSTDAGSPAPIAGRDVPAHVPDSLTSDAISRIIAMELPFVRARQELISEFQQRYIASMLEKQGNNVSRAAAASGLARRYFQILRARQR